MKKLSLLFAAFLLLLCIHQSISHEFWLRPMKFLVNPRETVKIDFRVGEEFTGEVWPVKLERMESLLHYHEDAEIDLLSAVTEGEEGGIDFIAGSRGTHLIAFESTPVFISLEADKFLEYLEEDGLLNVVEYRDENNLQDQEGRELYSRCVKTLLQAGSRTDDTYKKKVGAPLEIIPSINPYAIEEKEEVEIEVFFEGDKLENALVRVFHHHDGAVREDLYRTDEDGKISFNIIPEGRWMISVVRMVANEEPEDADWRSFWSSYTFGYE